MYEELLDKITAEIKADMETYHFVADPHSGHPKIIDICGRPISVFYDGVKDLKNKEYWNLLNEIHDDWLVNEVINRYVGKRDFLYLLGDVSLANRSSADKFLDRLNGNKFLVCGNHDKNILHSTRFSQITQIKDFTYSKFGLNIHGVLCHYPIASWNRKIHGSFHLYGHVHGRFAMSGLSFDVGIDNKELLKATGNVYRPLNLYEIITIMAEKEKNIKEETIRGKTEKT